MMGEQMYKIIRKTDWLDQSVSKDPMKGRVLLLEWFDKDGNTTQFSTNEQWEDSSQDNWENPTNSNIAYGNYFHGITKLNDEILFDFHYRAMKLFNWYLQKDICDETKQNITTRIEAHLEKIGEIANDLPDDDHCNEISDVLWKIREALK